MNDVDDAQGQAEQFAVADDGVLSHLKRMQAQEDKQLMESLRSIAEDEERTWQQLKSMQAEEDKQLAELLRGLEDQDEKMWQLFERMRAEEDKQLWG